jgi:hypothetical protein
MAEIALLIAPFFLFAASLFRIVKAHCGSNIYSKKAVRKNNTAKIKRVPLFSLPWQRKRRMLPVRTENKMAEPSFPLDVFRRIFFVLLLSIHDAWHHGSIVQKDLAPRVVG